MANHSLEERGRETTGLYGGYIVTKKLETAVWVQGFRGMIQMIAYLQVTGVQALHVMITQEGWSVFLASQVPDRTSNSGWGQVL